MLAPPPIAGAFAAAGKAFRGLSALPLWSEQERRGLKTAASDMDYGADVLLENLPREAEYEDDSGYARPSGGDMDIDELFRDL